MEKKGDDKIIFAWLASFFTLIGFIIAIIMKRDNKYVMFYAKQGLILFLGQIIIGLVSGVFLWLTSLIWIFWLILWVMTWINALSGEKKDTLLIGKLANKIKL